MPWWTSDRHGDANWPSHMERRHDGSIKIKAKKPPVTYIHLVEEGVVERRFRLKDGSIISGYSGDRESFSRGTSSIGSTCSTGTTGRLPPTLYRPPPVPSPPAPATVVTLDFPSNSRCGSSESAIGGSDTESDHHSRSSASSSTDSSSSRRRCTLDDYPTYRLKRSQSPASSTASSRSRTFPLDLQSNVSSVSIASTSSSKSSLPHPREPSPPPSPVFPRPPASPISSVAESTTTDTSTTSSGRSVSKPSVSVNVVACEPSRSIVGSDDGSSQTYSNYDSAYGTPSVVTAPEKPIALRRTWTRPQPLPVLQPIRTDFSAYQVGYSPYVPYPEYDSRASSAFSPTKSRRRVRRADRTPRSPWAVMQTPQMHKIPKTPKTPKTPRLARTPRAVRIKTHKREKPHIIQVPRTPRTPLKPRVPFESSQHAPQVITASSSVGSYRGRPPSPTGSYVRTESGSRERRRQRRAALAARKAKASAAVMAMEASEANQSVPRRPPPQIVISNSGSKSGSSSISSRRSHRTLTPVRVVAPQLPQVRRRKSALALSRHRTEPIRSPIVDVHHPLRTPRRKSATAGLEKDPRVIRADEPTWSDYLKDRDGVVETRAGRPSVRGRPSEARRGLKATTKSGPSLFGGYYESEAPRRSSTPTARSMRPTETDGRKHGPADGSGSAGGFKME
ncbi:hypothetical protein Sste5346_000073 [Sporothrix stenoceras]|uniref:Uncharacterized protein n=1 Tax=Sporothrix stenoceras TaxID=5173 RepID=A0ABR3ZTJ7_9PEZI